MKQQQQGDVIIRQVDTVPTGAKIKNPINGRVILAEGEVTGHAHAIEQLDDCVLYEKDGALYLSVNHPVALRHEEHHTQTIEPGAYEIGIVQEYDYLSKMSRRVVD